jgi:hypothetical protein
MEMMRLSSVVMASIAVPLLVVKLVPAHLGQRTTMRTIRSLFSLTTVDHPQASQVHLKYGFFGGLGMA